MILPKCIYMNLTTQGMWVWTTSFMILLTQSNTFLLTHSHSTNTRFMIRPTQCHMILPTYSYMTVLTELHTSTSTHHRTKHESYTSKTELKLKKQLKDFVFNSLGFIWLSMESKQSLIIQKETSSLLKRKYTRSWNVNEQLILSSFSHRKKMTKF